MSERWLIRSYANRGSGRGYKIYRGPFRYRAVIYWRDWRAEHQAEQTFWTWKGVLGWLEEEKERWL